MKFLLLLAATGFFSASASADLSQQANRIQDLFNHPASTTTISDSQMNRGEARPKAVLKGVFYFGGSDVRRQLLSSGYKNTLCENGFSNVYSVYNRVSDTISCSSGSLPYQHIGEAKSSPSRGDKVYDLMANIYDIIKANGAKGPIYLHCYYGVHASNTIAQMVLKQFCGISDSTALSNWDKVDLYNSLGEPGTSKQLAKIRNFEPYSEFQITDREKATVCY